MLVMKQFLGIFFSLFWFSLKRLVCSERKLLNCCHRLHFCGKIIQILHASDLSCTEKETILKDTYSNCLKELELGKYKPFFYY